MSGNSSPVASPQQEPHPRLADVVERHRRHAWRAPLHQPTREQFARWLATRASTLSLVVDLGCGTGDSSLGLEAVHAQAEILGVDQSAHRLARLAPSGFARHGRVALIRAEAATVLRLLAQAQIGIDTLYLLYPNPWPKPEHLLRRWHGHPVFPQLLASARTIVLRTNWDVYAEEFAQAARICGRQAEVSLLDADAPPLTPFERKYRASAHACLEWRSSQE